MDLRNLQTCREFLWVYFTCMPAQVLFLSGAYHTFLSLLPSRCLPLLYLPAKLQGPFFYLCNLFPEPAHLSWLTFYHCDLLNKLSLVFGETEEFISAKLMAIARSKISNAPENDSPAVSFMYLTLRRECKKITWRWKKARLGLDYRIVNKIMCSLAGGYFKSVLT